MKFEARFSIGDEVAVIQNIKREVLIPCPACEGKGKVTLADSVERTCPACYGQRNERTWEPTQWRLAHIGIVGRVSVSTTVTEGGGVEDEVRYMIDATGIGSGTVWKEADLCTLGSYEAECDSRNAQESASAGEEKP